MKLLPTFVLTCALTVAVTVFAQTDKHKTSRTISAPAVGSRFAGVGKITLHRGEPCTSQIVFDFHRSREIVWLAAAVHESRILTDAAKDRRAIRITGVWKRGASSGCHYVEVKTAAVEPGFWSRLLNRP